MHYHIVGIGGAGMSAIAHILLDRGDSVSGSDANQSNAWAPSQARCDDISQGMRRAISPVLMWYWLPRQCIYPIPNSTLPWL
jgi:UDP-N-acetylmuramate-alanine ligase